MARRAKRITGLIPRLWDAFLGFLRFLLRYPQILVAVAIVSGCVFGCWKVMTESSAFDITQVKVQDDLDLRLPNGLIGQNIWQVDIKFLAKELKSQKPYLKNLRVIRVLPNTLKIEATHRRPVSQVHIGKWYAVDSDGFILPDSNATPWEDLIILKGVSSPQSPLKIGGENSGERLLSAIRIASSLKGSSYFGNYHLSGIDISDPKQLNIFLDESIEIRCGSEEELSLHLDRLKSVLRKVANNPIEIRYIDVRFNEPVIGPRT